MAGRLSSPCTEKNFFERNEEIFEREVKKPSTATDKQKQGFHGGW